MEWRWHRLDHMQIIDASLQTDNHASVSTQADTQTAVTNIRFASATLHAKCNDFHWRPSWMLYRARHCVLYCRLMLLYMSDSAEYEYNNVF